MKKNQKTGAVASGSAAGKEIIYAFSEELPVALIIGEITKSGGKLVYANKKAEELLLRDKERMAVDFKALLSSLYGDNFSTESSKAVSAYTERGDGSALKLLAKCSFTENKGFILSLENIGSKSDDLETIAAETAKNRILADELKCVAFDYEIFTDRLNYILPGEKNSREYIDFIKNIHSLSVLPYSTADEIVNSLEELRQKPSQKELEIRSNIDGTDRLYRLKLLSLGDKYATVRRIVGIMCDIRSGGDSGWLYLRNSMLMENNGISLLDYDVRRDILLCCFRSEDELISKEYRSFRDNVLGVPFVSGKDKEKFAAVFRQMYNGGGSAEVELLCSWNGAEPEKYLFEFLGVSDEKGRTDHILIKLTAVK